MIMRDTHAQAAIKAAFGLATIVFLLLSWLAIRSTSELHASQGIMQPFDRTLVLTGLIATALILPVLWTLVLESRTRHRAESSLQEIPEGVPDALRRARMTPDGARAAVEVEALRAAVRRLEDAQAAAGIGDWTCDLASGALTWSKQLYTILQRDPVLCPPSLAEQVALFDEGAGSTADAFLSAQETGEPQSYDVTFRQLNRGPVALHVVVVPVRDEADAVVSMRGTIQDITERKMLEDRLRMAEEAAESSNRAKSMFLASMSHEIRTPMNGILGILELISLKPLDPDLRSAVELVRESGKSLQRILDDILDISKVEAGKLEVRTEPTSIHEVVADLQHFYAEIANSMGLQLRHSIDPLITPMVLVDGMRLRQILGNLVDNAIKFTPQGHVEVRVQLLERDGAREMLRFIVEDTGIGISREAQQRLFQPFEQARATVLKQNGGTGLGLTISRRLAELMGGTVGVTSELGQGTSLSLELPVTAMEHQPLTQATEGAPIPVMQPVTDAIAPRPHEDTVDRGLVLVVDDHPTNRKLLGMQLGTLGFGSEEAESGLQALELWKSGRFALVLTDCHMPAMSGYELSQLIRELEAERSSARTPIIACSADVLPGVVEKCMDAGMDDYVSKPTDLRVLAEKVKRWLPLPEVQDGIAVSLDAPSLDAPSAPERRMADERPGEGWALKRSTGDGPALTGRIVEQFRRVNDDDARQLAIAAEQGDMQSVIHFAHRIKGACGFIGAAPLASVCAMVEQAGRAEDGPGVQWLMDIFRTELEQLNAHLDTY